MRLSAKFDEVVHETPRDLVEDAEMDAEDSENSPRQEIEKRPAQGDDSDAKEPLPRGRARTI